jgi:hypothetical protein
MPSKEQIRAKKRSQAHFEQEVPDWNRFVQHTKRKSFVREIQGDDRADPKLRLHADRMGRLQRGKVLATVPGSAGRSYEIRRLPGGGLGCTCADWRYRKSVRPDSPGECKHIRSFMEKSRSKEGNMGKQAAGWLDTLRGKNISAAQQTTGIKRELLEKKLRGQDARIARISRRTSLPYGEVPDPSRHFISKKLRNAFEAQGNSPSAMLDGLIGGDSRIVDASKAVDIAATRATAGAYSRKLGLELGIRRLDKEVQTERDRTARARTNLGRGVAIAAPFAAYGAFRAYKGLRGALRKKSEGGAEKKAFRSSDMDKQAAGWIDTLRGRNISAAEETFSADRSLLEKKLLAQKALIARINRRSHFLYGDVLDPSRHFASKRMQDAFAEEIDSQSKLLNLTGIGDSRYHKARSAVGRAANRATANAQYRNLGLLMELEVLDKYGPKLIQRERDRTARARTNLGRGVAAGALALGGLGAYKLYQSRKRRDTEHEARTMPPEMVTAAKTAMFDLFGAGADHLGKRELADRLYQRHDAIQNAAQAVGQRIGEKLRPSDRVIDALTRDRTGTPGSTLILPKRFGSSAQRDFLQRIPEHLGHGAQVIARNPQTAVAALTPIPGAMELVALPAEVLRNRLRASGKLR